MKKEESVQVKVEITDGMRLFLRQHLADFSNDVWKGDISMSVNGSHIILGADHADKTHYNATISINDIIQSCIERIELERSADKS